MLQPSRSTTSPGCVPGHLVDGGSVVVVVLGGSVVVAVLCAAAQRGRLLSSKLPSVTKRTKSFIAKPPLWVLASVGSMPVQPRCRTDGRRGGWRRGDAP